MRTSRAYVLLIASLTACGGGSVTGPEGTVLRLDVVVAQSVIDVGDTTSAVITLENLSSEVVTIGFPSSCQILPYIGAQPSDDNIYPGGGNWVCATVITELTLLPRAKKTKTLLLRGGVASGSEPAIVLAPGEYLISARLASSEFPLRADPVSLTVQ